MSIFSHLKRLLGKLCVARRLLNQNKGLDWIRNSMDLGIGVIQECISPF